MKPGTTKIGTRIWIPLLEKFSQRMDSACLRRDIWLARVLEHELPRIEPAITTPNSAAARDFIAAHLDALPRKLMTLTLPEGVARRLDEFCESRRIVRDSFFNRLFFLLLGNYDLKTRLFFDVPDWFPRTLERTGFSSDAAGELLSAIPDFRDPFLAIREGQSVWRKELIEEFGTAERADAHLHDYGIYTALLTDRTLGEIDLYGLNLHLPDMLVPGTSDHDASAALLDEFLEHTVEPKT